VLQKITRFIIFYSSGAEGMLVMHQFSVYCTGLVTVVSSIPGNFVFTQWSWASTHLSLWLGSIIWNIMMLHSWELKLVVVRSVLISCRLVWGSGTPVVQHVRL